MNKLPLDIQFFATSVEVELTVTYKTYGHPKTTSVQVKVVSPSPISVSTIPTGWTSENDYTITKTYYSNQTESITVSVGESSMSEVETTAIITVNQIGTVNTREESYAYCGSKCKHPVYTKNEIDSKFLYGTTSPSNSLGKDGDIYFMYED